MCIECVGAAWAAPKWDHLWQADELPEQFEEGAVFVHGGSGERKIRPLGTGRRAYRCTVSHSQGSAFFDTVPSTWTDADSTIELRLRLDEDQPDARRVMGLIINSAKDRWLTGFMWSRTGAEPRVEAAEASANAATLPDATDFVTYRVYYRADTNKADLYRLNEENGQLEYVLTSVGVENSSLHQRDWMRIGNYSRSMAGTFEIEHLCWTNKGISGRPAEAGEGLSAVSAEFAGCVLPRWAEAGIVPVRLQADIAPAATAALVRADLRNDAAGYHKQVEFKPPRGGRILELPLEDAPPGELSVVLTLHIGAKRLRVDRCEGSITMFSRIHRALGSDMPEIKHGEAVLLRNMAPLAECRPRALRVLPYTTVTGENGAMAQPVGHLAMGFVVYWPYPGRFALTAGVSEDTAGVSVQFGHRAPETWKAGRPVPDGSAARLHEIYLGAFTNDQRDCRLRIGLPRGGRLAYLKAVPYPAPEWPVSKLAGNRRVLLDNDGYSVFVLDMFLDAADMAAYTAKYRDTDIQGVIWCVGNNLEVNYSSRLAPLYLEGTTDFPSASAKKVHDAVRRYVDAGEDTLDASIRICHENDLLCFASLRMNKAPSPVYDKDRPFELYERFKDMRIYETPTARGTNLSYAFEEVRSHALALLKEMAQRRPDAILLEFCRCPPHVGFHPELVAKFRRLHNVPAETPIDPSDPRWLAIKSEPLTQLMREVRAMARDQHTRSGKPMSVAAHIFHERLLEESAIDIDTWLEEGLVDILLVSSKLEYMRLEPWSIEPFTELVRGKPITVYGEIDSHYGGHDPTPEEEAARKRGEKVDSGSREVTIDYYRKRAHDLYRQGSDGVMIWDGFFNLGIVHRLGDRDGLDEWYRFERPARAYSETVLIE